jgi:hypothetical protein
LRVSSIAYLGDTDPNEQFVFYELIKNDVVTNFVKTCDGIPQFVGISAKNHSL